MKNVTPLRNSALLATTLALSTLAHAHPGQELVYDCASGLVHPFHGLDHLLSMIAVGILAAQQGGRARWILPVAFITIMSCAAMLGVRGPALPGMEIMIATSVLALGMLIGAAARLSLAAAAAIVGLFAVVHGIAHGAEMPTNSAPLTYGAGFVISTAFLHGLGLLFAHLANLKSAQLPRIAGFAFAAIGAVLLLA